MSPRTRPKRSAAKASRPAQYNAAPRSLDARAHREIAEALLRLHLAATDHALACARHSGREPTHTVRRRRPNFAGVAMTAEGLGIPLVELVALYEQRRAATNDALIPSLRGGAARYERVEVLCRK